MLRLLTFALLLLALPNAADAFVRTISEAGRPLFWPSPTLTLQANPINRSGLSDAQAAQGLSQAFSSWSIPGTSATVNFSSSRSVPANSGFNGVNSVYFSSAGNYPLGYGVLAVTEVLYYTASGQIAETDMVFNDYDFKFTMNEGDTGKTFTGMRNIYLPDVATHEAGHAFGLDHTNVSLSSLIFTAFSGQFVLGGDDQTGIRTIYPSSGGKGALEGNVTGLRGGIFGAHVVALNLETGMPEAGTLSNADGSFRIGDLSPGKYAVMMEPYLSDITSISSFYSNVNHRFCGNNLFRRRFYGPCGSNQASVLDVRAGETVSLHTLSPSCNQLGNPGGTPSPLPQALTFPSTGGALFGTLGSGQTHYYRIRGVGGNLKAKVAAYSAYSNIDVRVDILDDNGNAIAGTTAVDDIQDPMPGGLKNYDASAEANLPNGDYVIRVQAASQRLSSSLYPAGFLLQDANGHYLLSVAVNGSLGPVGATDMSSCVTVNNRVQSPSVRAPASSNTREQGGGGCGSLGGGGAGGSGGSGPWNGGAMQFLLAALLLQLGLMARRKKPALVRQRRR